MKWKVGDELMVRVKVARKDSNTPRGYCIEFSSGQQTWLHENVLASATLIERPLAVGDRVMWGPLDRGYTISSIDGNLAVVRHGIVAWLAPLSELRRAAEPA